jgi:hypothetical protein
VEIVVFRPQAFDRDALDEANKQFNHQLVPYRENLSRATATMAAECPGVCAFVDDTLYGSTLSQLLFSDRHAPWVKRARLRNPGDWFRARSRWTALRLHRGRQGVARQPSVSGRQAVRSRGEIIMRTRFLPAA